MFYKTEYSKNENKKIYQFNSIKLKFLYFWVKTILINLVIYLVYEIIKIWS